MANILIVDDEEYIREIFKFFLEINKHQTTLAESGEEAIKLLQDNIFDLAIVDLKMGIISGMDVLKSVKEISPDTEVIIVTAYGTVNDAVEAMRLGAYDFLTKPLNLDEFKLFVDRALEKKEIANGVKALKTQTRSREKFSNIIGMTPAMLDVFTLIEKVSRFDSAVFITGESGTGKELVARTIHANSLRSKESFIPVNCAAIPESLQESEFFGYVSGAFTDAKEGKKGLFEEADNGTIFLDEIADASLSTQVKLLRFLEDGEVRRVGGNISTRVNVRLITATNKDIKKAIEEKTFREDLYYRINVVEIPIPPLRERKDDIPILVQHFIQKYSQRSKKVIAKVSPDVYSILMEFDWPGNVRELQNVILHALTFTKNDIILPESLPDYVRLKNNKGSNKTQNEYYTINELEKAYISLVLENYSWDFKKVADILGIGKATIYRKVKEYGLKRPI